MFNKMSLMSTCQFPATPSWNSDSRVPKWCGRCQRNSFKKIAKRLACSLSPMSVDPMSFANAIICFRIASERSIPNSTLHVLCLLFCARQINSIGRALLNILVNIFCEQSKFLNVTATEENSARAPLQRFFVTIFAQWVAAIVFSNCCQHFCKQMLTIWATSSRRQ